jgi:1-propanol dehydrogenase
MAICQIVTKVITGENSLATLQQYHDQRILIVCDPFLKENGSVDLVTSQLHPSNTVTVFADTQPDPTLEVIASGVAAAAVLQPALLIGFGGGAAIDTAKGIEYFAVKGNAVQQQPTLIAIPTTSGTGSEMTAFAVFTDSAAKRKIAFVDDLMYAAMAILDPHLTLTVPPVVTANTGFDVLTHAIEAYVSRSASHFTDGVAYESIELALAALPRCYHYGGNMTARKDMLTASNLAGTAFNLSGLGLAHSLAHQLGGMYHVPHGAACAICLPLSMAYNSNDAAVCAKYADIAYKIGIAPRTMNPVTAVKSVIAVLKALMEDMNMPARIGEFSSPPVREAYERTIPQMAANTLQDRCLRENRRPVSLEAAAELLQQAY